MFQENSDASRRNNARLNNYYENLRSNVMSILGHVKVPNEQDPNVVGHSGHPENFDSYLTKLQTICTDNMNDEGKPVYESMKSAIHNFNALSTRI